MYKEDLAVDNLQWLIIFTNPSARVGYDPRSIFKRSLIGLNSEFSFSYTSCPTKAVEPSLPYYLPIAGGRIIGIIPFPRVLVLCEMQSILSRNWTRVAVSISYDDNYVITGTTTYNGWYAIKPNQTKPNQNDLILRYMTRKGLIRCKKNNQPTNIWKQWWHCLFRYCYFSFAKRYIGAVSDYLSV